MALRVGGDTSQTPQVMRPRAAGSSPIAARRRVVFPEPLGPIRTVGAPAEKLIEMLSKIVTPPARIPTSENTMGRSEARARTLILRRARRHDARPTPAR